MMTNQLEWLENPKTMNNSCNFKEVQIKIYLLHNYGYVAIISMKNES